jgi:hypothetical protein
MAGPEHANRQKHAQGGRSARTNPAELKGWKYFGSLIMTFGLAALITSSFGLGESLVTGRQQAQEWRCSIAGQIVLDDSPSPALTTPQLARLSRVATDRIEECIGVAE